MAFGNQSCSHWLCKKTGTDWGPAGLTSLSHIDTATGICKQASTTMPHNEMQCHLSHVTEHVAVYLGLCGITNGNLNSSSADFLSTGFLHTHARTHAHTHTHTHTNKHRRGGEGMETEILLQLTHRNLYTMSHHNKHFTNPFTQDPFHLSQQCIVATTTPSQPLTLQSIPTRNHLHLHFLSSKAEGGSGSPEAG